MAKCRARAYATALCRCPRPAPAPAPALLREGAMDKITLYWRDATADAVGATHGVTDAELSELQPRVKSIERAQTLHVQRAARPDARRAAALRAGQRAPRRQRVPGRFRHAAHQEDRAS